MTKAVDPEPGPAPELACQNDIAGDPLALEGRSLDLLMPMHAMVGPDATILRVGPTLAKLRPGEMLIGRDFFEVFDIRRPRGCGSLEDLLDAEGGRVWLAFRSGIRSHFKAVAVPLPDGTGGLINLSFGISVVEAVHLYELTSIDFAATDLAVEMLYLVEAKSAALAESKKLNLRLQGAKVAAEEQAFTDTLTGLKNRRALDHVLGRLAANGIPFGLVHLDLDYFKQVNDTHGHAAGDEVLQAVARVLVSETRGTDTAARVGGDEFVLVFPDLVDLGKLAVLSDRVIKRLQEPVPFGTVVCQISGSAGIVTTELCPGADPETLQRDADLALYASKRAGRGRYTIFRPDMLHDEPG